MHVLGRDEQGTLSQAKCCPQSARAGPPSLLFFKVGLDESSKMSQAKGDVLLAEDQEGRHGMDITLKAGHIIPRKPLRDT